jgi:uncharacterized protein YjbI with pentapeptide repeats
MWVAWAVYFVAALFLSASLLFATVLFVQLLSLAWDARTHAEEINKLLLALAGLIGAPFVVWRVVIASRQNAIALENVRNTLFSKAVEQLGATRERKLTSLVPQEGEEFDSSSSTEANFEVRLGAIYALEKLAREDLELHWPIMETLCAYVRQNAGPAIQPPREFLQRSFSPSTEQRAVAERYLANLKPPTVDVAAAIQVLGRRSQKGRALEISQRNLTENKDSLRLNLGGCQLASAMLSGLDFRAAKFNDANLVFAKLENGEFAEATFEGACLAHADLTKANMVGADLRGAQLEKAILVKAELQTADMTSAQLDGADLTAAHLQFARFFREGVGIESSAERRVSYPTLYFLPGQTVFAGADLANALLDFVDLRGAVGLTQDQIDRACGNEFTTLPQSCQVPSNERWLPTSSSPVAKVRRDAKWKTGRRELLAIRLLSKAK